MYPAFVNPVSLRSVLYILPAVYSHRMNFQVIPHIIFPWRARTSQWSSCCNNASFGILYDSMSRRLLLIDYSGLFHKKTEFSFFLIFNVPLPSISLHAFVIILLSKAHRLAFSCIVRIQLSD